MVYEFCIEHLTWGSVGFHRKPISFVVACFTLRHLAHVFHVSFPQSKSKNDLSHLLRKKRIFVEFLERIAAANRGKNLKKVYVWAILSPKFFALVAGTWKMFWLKKRKTTLSSILQISDNNLRVRPLMNTMKSKKFQIKSLDQFSKYERKIFLRSVQINSAGTFQR